MPKVSLEDARHHAQHDYNKFCVEWGDYIRKLVIGSGSFSYSDIDDVVQELLLIFYEKGYLERYDPLKGTSFSTSVYNFVSKRILRQRDNRFKQMVREGLSLNDTYTVKELYEVSYIDDLESHPESVSYEFLDTVKSVYAELSKYPAKYLIDDFPKLFSCIVQQIVYGISPECREALGEKVAGKDGRNFLNRKALAYEMGVSESTVGLMLIRLAKIPAVEKLLGR